MSGVAIYRRMFLAGVVGVAGLLSAASFAQAQSFTAVGLAAALRKSLRQIGRVAEGEGLVAVAGRLPVAVVGPEQHHHRDG